MRFFAYCKIQSFWGMTDCGQFASFKPKAKTENSIIDI